MRISIHTLGTRGDVQPYLALAVELQRRGQEIMLAGPAQFADFVRDRGVAFAELPADFLELMETPEGKAALADGKGFGAGLKLVRHIGPLMQRLLAREWEIAREFAPELMVYHPKSLATPHIAEKLDVPTILTSPLPGFTPTSAFPSPLLPFANLGPLNRASHLLATQGANVLFGKLLRQWRRDGLGLGRGGGWRPVGTIYAYSPHVIPVPSDWGHDVLVSGYWFLDEPAWTMPKDLEAFLAAGSRPVYVGFGSMPGLDPQATTAAISQALAKAGQRGIMASGGGALAAGAVGEHLHSIAAAPHEHLFKHVSATLHHGGAGTTGASLRAGLPMAICPFFGDQPFWARRMEALGVAPAALDRRALAPDAIAVALEAIAGDGMRQSAERLADQIASEDGVGVAADFIERRAASAPRRVRSSRR